MTPVRSLSNRLRPLALVVTLFALVALRSSSTSAQKFTPPAARAPKAAAGLTPAQIASINKVLSTEMTAQGIPGASVAVVTDLQLQWAGGFGMADVENGVPATADTNYRIASINKSLTAVALMQLVEAGKMDLDAPIQKYVPSFPQKQWPVIVRDVMHHVSGIRHYKKVNDAEKNSTKFYPTLAEGLNLFKDDPLEFKPGTKYLYSSQGYTLLALAVQGASGVDYYDYLQKHIFDPAGMVTARVDSVAAIIPHRTQGYVRPKGGGPLQNSALADTSNKGGLCSTAVDVAKFGIAFLSGKLVKPETVEQMFKVHPATQRDKNTLGYGLGFSVTWTGSKPGEGERIINKTGDQQRVCALLYLRPEKKCIVVLMFNLEATAHRLEIARAISDIALGQAGGTQP
jgi:serine beta-lactamase-like protein LACTB, mitochondrial